MSLGPYVIYYKEEYKIKGNFSLPRSDLGSTEMMSDINNTKFPSFATGWLSLYSE
jgi:hypothetical protein